MEPRRIHRYSAMVGTVAWIAWQLLTNAAGPALLLLLSPLVLVPLLLANLAEDPSAEPAPMWRALIWTQLPCALLLPLGMSMRPSAFALLACVPWAGWTALLAGEGLRRLVGLYRNGGLPGVATAELALVAGLVFPLVGSVWLLADRLGVGLLGFSPLFVLLTAVHFHHAGLSLPIIAGLLGRERREPVYRIAAVTIVLAVPLVALGITFSPLLELVGSLLTAAAATVVGLGMLIRARDIELVPALLSACAGAALLGAMCFAASYAIGEFWRVPWPDLIAMIQLHGAVNALGFGLLGAWAWYLVPAGGADRSSAQAEDTGEAGSSSGIVDSPAK